VGADGQLAGEVAYDSFGNPLLGGSLPGTERYGFTGRESDAGGLAYYRSRYYLPDIGRFAGEDRIGFRGNDLNLYRYVHNAPTVFVDPTGEVSALEYAVILTGPPLTIAGALCVSAPVAKAFHETMNEIARGLEGLSVNTGVYNSYGPGGPAEIVYPLVPYACLAGLY